MRTTDISVKQLMVGLNNFLLFVVGSLLGLRFILKLFAANAGNGFVDWVYDSSAQIMEPFRNIFPTLNVEGVEGSVFEFSTLFAMVVYGLIGLVVFYLIDLLSASKTN